MSEIEKQKAWGKIKVRGGYEETATFKAGREWGYVTGSFTLMAGEQMMAGDLVATDSNGKVWKIILTDSEIERAQKMGDKKEESRGPETSTTYEDERLKQIEAQTQKEREQSIKENGLYDMGYEAGGRNEKRKQNKKSEQRNEQQHVAYMNSQLLYERDSERTRVANERNQRFNQIYAVCHIAGAVALFIIAIALCVK